MSRRCEFLGCALREGGERERERRPLTLVPRLSVREDAYEPGARNCHWLKLKKDYLEGVGDTIDVVPIGAFHGKVSRVTCHVMSPVMSCDDPD